MYPAHGEATENDRLFILCDGMGGHDAGEVASATVCEAMSKSILQAVPDPEGGFSRSTLDRALADAFMALDMKDNGAEKKMGTTMTLLKLYDEGYLIAHMGDSRVYHIRPGKTEKETRILFRTEDHSLVNDLVKIGELTPEEAKHSRQKNVITRAMQPHMERHPKADVHVSDDIQAGDYFYLCSDGMLENMEDEQLCYFFSDSAGTDEEKVDKLTKATVENRDNHSAIMVHILEVDAPRRKAPEPVSSGPVPVYATVEDNDEDDKASVAGTGESDSKEEAPSDDAAAAEEKGDSEVTEAAADKDATEEENQEETAGKEEAPTEEGQKTSSGKKRFSLRFCIVAAAALVVALALAFCAVLLTRGSGEDKQDGKDKTEQPVPPKQPEAGSEHEPGAED